MFLGYNIEVKLGDFGLSTTLDSLIPSKRGVCGTPNYMSPEMLLKEDYDFWVDIWSLGVVIYYLKFGRAPFSGKTTKETYKNIKEINYKIPESEK